MILVRILLMLTAFFFVTRTYFRCFGCKITRENQIIDVFVCELILFCVFYATKLKIILLLALLIPFFCIISSIKRKSVVIEDVISDFLDQILMNMRAGMSFGTAQMHLNPARGPWEKWISPSTNDQETEIVTVLRTCGENSSQTFKILSSFRHSLQLQMRLYQKQNAMTLQARAQAGVSVGLFAVLFLAQSLMQPDFLVFLNTSGGKLAVVISVSLVLGGVRWVFWLSRPREMQL
jgi:Flp pilus assembly protein TadB